MDSIHSLLSHYALVWLSNKAYQIRGATEVALLGDYVADAVAVARLNNAEQFRTNFPKKSRYWSFCFEAKTSRGDFLSSFNNSPKHANRRDAVCNFHWVVIPKGIIIELFEVPLFWGLLQRSGKGLKELKPALFCPETKLQRLEVESRILWSGRLSAHHWGETWGYHVREHAIYVGAWEKCLKS